MVRSNHAIIRTILTLVALGLSPSERSGAAQEVGSTPFVERPYRILALVAVEPGVRLDTTGRDRLLEGWRRLARRFVGAPWSLEIRPAPVEVAAIPPDELKPGHLTALGEGRDAVWSVRIVPSTQEAGGLELQGRALETTTDQLGPVRHSEVSNPNDLERSLFRLGLELFAPGAEVVGYEGGQVRIRVQGGALAAASPEGQVVRPGSVFVPIRLFRKPDGSLLRITPISWTYLVVHSVEGGMALCDLVSSLRDPLTRRVVGASEIRAVGLAPGSEPLRFRFEERPPNSRPAAGYRVTVRTPPDGRPRDVGITGRDGRIIIPPPARQEGPLLVRVLAGDAEPLAEFPVMPGETDQERVIRFDPKTEAVALESKVRALQDQVVDQVALRSRLRSLLESRVQGNAWDDVRALLAEFRTLPDRDVFAKRLAELRSEAETTQAELKRPVLTATTLAQLQETETLITTYLDDEAFRAYQQAAQDAATGAVLSPGSEWQPFEVPGQSLAVILPGKPERTRTGLPLGVGREPMTTYALTKDGRTYVVGASVPVDGPRGRDMLRPVKDALLANQPGARILAQSDVTRAGMPGLDWRIEVKSGAEGESQDAPQQQRTTIVALPNGGIGLVSVVAPASAISGREVESFLNSVRPPEPTKK
jgi:hypothetical protein